MSAAKRVCSADVASDSGRDKHLFRLAETRFYFTGEHVVSMSTKIRIASIGVGGMGGTHLKLLGENPKAQIVAVCDTEPSIADSVAAKYGAKAYYDHRTMLAREKLDAITIATPHYDHPPIAIDAFHRGIHVLSEKPIGVSVKAARKAVAAHQEAKAKYPDLLYAIMFQERTLPYIRKLKDILLKGELGKLTRTTWIHTDWYRTQFYYDHGNWRATWRGEGGGVLLNQCPHTLDAWQWLVGQPDRVTAQLSLGKYHDIEVEDEATAYFKYNNGMIGHFFTTTAETPGVNRLEIAGEYGRLVLDNQPGNQKIIFHRNKISSIDHLKTAQSSFVRAPYETFEVPFDNAAPQGHAVVVDTFLSCILDGTPLIAEAKEGLNSLEMSNAMMLSSFTNRSVPLPIDEDAFEQQLAKRIATSRFQKKVAITGALDFNESWKVK
jgi:predicted dehydrogenase